MVNLEMIYRVFVRPVAIIAKLALKIKIVVSRVQKATRNQEITRSCVYK